MLLSQLPDLRVRTASAGHPESILMNSTKAALGRINTSSNSDSFRMGSDRLGADLRFIVWESYLRASATAIIAFS